MSKKTFEVRIAPDECKGCERCVIACPRSVLKMGVQLNRLGVPFVIRTEQECIGCGGCFLTCRFFSRCTYGFVCCFFSSF